MQILVFEKNKELITHLVNCNVGGLPLKWNRTGSFDHFPLRANGLYEPQHRVKLSVMGEYLQPQLTEEDFQQILDHHDYLYVIVYTRCMASMSRGMFDHMDKYIEKFSNEKVRYLYVYAEDLYVELDKKKSK